MNEIFFFGDAGVCGLERSLGWVEGKIADLIQVGLSGKRIGDWRCIWVLFEVAGGYAVACVVWIEQGWSNCMLREFG